MLGKEISDLLIAINIYQSKLPNEVNTSITENTSYDRKRHFLARYFEVSVWENKHPEKVTIYKKHELIAHLVNLLDEYRT